MNYGFVRHGIVYVATNKVTGEQYKRKGKVKQQYTLARVA